MVERSIPDEVMTTGPVRELRGRRTQRWMGAGLIAAVLFTGGFIYLLATPDMPALPYELERGPRIQTARGMTPLEAFDAVTLAVIDLDGDGVNEIITHNDNGRLYVWSGRDGKLVIELETKHPDPWEARELAGPAIGDLNGNGLLDIVITNSAGWVTAFEVERKEGGGTEFVKLWQVRLDPHKMDPNYSKNMYYGSWEGHPGLDGPAYLADVTGDGKDEVFVQLDDMPGLYKLNSEGEPVWFGNYSDGNSGPRVADLTGNGRLEVVYASDGGQLHIFNAQSMGYRCAFDAPKQRDIWPGSISVPPTIADFTGDGRLEIAFGVRNITRDRDDPDWIHRSHAAHFLVDADCKIVWKKSWPWNNPHVHMSPAAVDVTGNGVLDLIFHDWNTVGHNPGNWEPTGAANLYAIEGATGKLLWQRQTTTYWSNKNIAVADVIGDGTATILVNEDEGGLDGIGLYRLTGGRAGFIPAPPGWEVTRGPVVVDLDGDGYLDILLPIHRQASGCPRDLDVGCRQGAIQIYRTRSTAEPLVSNNHLLSHGIQ